MAHGKQLLYIAFFSLYDADISLCTHRCILNDQEVLHQAGFAHTDLRQEYIIPQHDGQWVLIGMEFACVLNSVPFTPEGEPTSCGFLYVNVSVCSLACLQSKDFKASLQPVSLICMIQLY